MRRHNRVLLLMLVLLLTGGSVAVGDTGWHGQRPPNDPGYAPAEQDPVDHCINDEQWYLYSFIPKCTPRATDPQGSAGMFIDQAWKRFTTGRPDVTVAYIEGGVNWRLGADTRAELAPRAYLNTGELPLPEHADGSTCASYDCNRDGQVSVEDYAADPRVHRPYFNGDLTPEDLIIAFGHCQIVHHRIGPRGCPPGAHFDNDHDGYANDISGWNFSRGNNDPATADSAYNHSDQESAQAVAETDNGVANAGICPHCTLLYVKAGDEALDRTDRTAQAIYFAVDSHASVIVAVVGELGYSSLERRALDYAWRKGVVVVMASNDFDSTDHQAGMFWPRVWPGNGLVSDGSGTVSQAAHSDHLATSFRERSNLTSFGTHALFSTPTVGGSTSESTPTQGGVAALLASYGRIAAEQGHIHGRLDAGEIKQVLRATVSPITDPHLGWPGKPGTTFNIQYGYGRPDVLAAMEAVQQGRIPPVPDILSPDWYALLDPTRTRSVPIVADLSARRARSFGYRVQYAIGPEPTEAEFHTIAGAHVRGRHLTGTIARLDMRRIPAAVWRAALHETADLSSTEQYTVTLRVQMTDDRGNLGEDRRSIAVFHDPTLEPGYPLKLAHGAASQPDMVDLNGDGRLDLVFADDDGGVHAIDVRSGRELRGWPAHTLPLGLAMARTPAGRSHAIPAAREPVFAPVAVGDLQGNGLPDVVVTSQSGRVYVFGYNGRLLPGWPRAMGADVPGMSVPPPDRPHTRSPSMGAFAAPVLVRLPGGHGLDVLQAAWDGKLYAFDRRGHAVPGWPVEVTLPPGTRPGGCIPIDDHKLIATPTVADLNGDGNTEIVEKSQFWCSSNGDLGPAALTYTVALYGDGNRHPGGPLLAGWPVQLTSTLGYYNSAQDWLTEGGDSASAADINGNGRDEIIQTAGWLGSPYVIQGNGSSKPLAPQPALSPGLISGLAAVGQELGGTLAPGIGSSTVQAPSSGPAPVGFATSGAFARVAGRLTWFSGGTDATSLLALAQPGQAQRIVNYMRAYDPATTSMLAGFPAQVMGLPFLTAPAVADVSGDGHPDVINNEDSSNVVAFQGDGSLVPSWPKFTGGWTLWTPAVGDIYGDGRNEVAAVTREGYLFVWKTPGRASSTEAWTWHQNDWHNGRYGTDTRAPGALRHLQVHGRRLCLSAPGDNGYIGVARRYELRGFSTRPSPQRFLAGRVLRVNITPAPPGTRQCTALPRGTRWVALQAVNATGLRSFPVFARIAGVPRRRVLRQRHRHHRPRAQHHRSQPEFPG